MMDNASQILWQMPTNDASLANNHFGGLVPFKLQVNLNKPIFEGQIDVDVVDKWLNLFEGYFWSIVSSIRRRLLFHCLRLLPLSRASGKCTVRKALRNLFYLQSNPLGTLSEMFSKNNITLWGAMRTRTYSGPYYNNKVTKMCMSSQIFS